MKKFLTAILTIQITVIGYFLLGVYFMTDVKWYTLLVAIIGSSILFIPAYNWWYSYFEKVFNQTNNIK